MSSALTLCKVDILLKYRTGFNLHIWYYGYYGIANRFNLKWQGWAAVSLDCTDTSNWISVVCIFVCVSCFFSEVITSRLHRVCQWYVTVRTMKHVVITKFTDIYMFILLVCKKRITLCESFFFLAQAFWVLCCCKYVLQRLSFYNSW